MKSKKTDAYYFFRSLFISSAICWTLIAFAFLFGLAWQRMQYTSFGIKDAKPIEITENGVRILDFYIG